MARQKKTNKSKTEEQKQQALEDLKRHMAEMQAEEERLNASTVPTSEYLENIRKTHKDPYWMSCQLPTI